MSSSRTVGESSNNASIGLFAWRRLPSSRHASAWRKQSVVGVAVDGHAVVAAVWVVVVLLGPRRAFLRASRAHPTLFATGITDLSAGCPRLLEVTQGQSGTVLTDWLSDRDQEWKQQINTASLDPFHGYATALATHLPPAIRVLDPFHVVTLGLSCVDDVRRRVQHETTGHGVDGRTRSMASAA